MTDMEQRGFILGVSFVVILVTAIWLGMQTK